MGRNTDGIYTFVSKFVDMPMYTCVYKQTNKGKYLILKFYVLLNKLLSSLLCFKTVALNSCLVAI